MVLVLALLAWAGLSVFGSYRSCERRILALQGAPMRLAVDLAKPGLYSGTYTQLCQPPAGLGLYVEPAADVGNIEPDGVVLSGLAATIAMRDSSGRAVYEQHLDSVGGLCQTRSSSGRQLVGLWVRDLPLAVGVYTMELEVEKAALALDGVPHTLVAKYDISLLPMLSMCLLAFVGLILAAMLGVIALCVWIGHSARARLRRQRQMSGCCGGCGYELTSNSSGACPECGGEQTSTCEP